MAVTLLKVDLAQLEAFQQDLSGISDEVLGDGAIQAINDVVDRTYHLARKTILSGINLTDEYVQRKMAVEHATRARLKGEIVAFGGKGFLTSLSHYGAIQLTDPVNWTNERIAAMGEEFGPWPGWTKRVGNAAVDIAVNKKAAGRSVEVVQGNRKKIGPAFALPGKRDNDGNLLVFRRIKGTRKKTESLSGPSVYQLFRIAIPKIEDDVEDDLADTLVDFATNRLQEYLT